MLECDVKLFCTLYMPTCYIHFICLIQIQNTEICTVYRKSAKKYRDISARIAQPYFEEACIW